MASDHFGLKFKPGDRVRWDAASRHGLATTLYGTVLSIIPGAALPYEVLFDQEMVPRRRAAAELVEPAAPGWHGPNLNEADKPAKAEPGRRVKFREFL
jgi:hypothetical protein